MDVNKVVLYCRKCRKLVNIQECYREERVFPEDKPEFNIATWCCSICSTPIMEVSEYNKVKR